ncbi:MAG: AAA family ATPase [Pseudomonas sp.]|jgi:NadR type nicotinamide-nucleotide adenylyltransferase|nr:AAA family ATPase [Pseudomonas sp.]
MKVVVLTGPESAGKSTLSQALAKRFNAPLVSEYVRAFIDQTQRDTQYADISTIAEQQLQRERAARAQQPHLLLLDTHLLSNKLWSETLFGRSPAWIETALKAQHYDLIGLLSPSGIPWQADGQRCQPELAERQQFHQALADWLQLHQQSVLPLDGSWQARYQQLESAIEQLLQNTAASTTAPHFSAKSI